MGNTFRIAKITPYHDTHCGGPAPKPYTALVDEDGGVVATLRKEVEYFDTHMGGKPETYDVWEWKR